MKKMQAAARISHFQDARCSVKSGALKRAFARREIFCALEREEQRAAARVRAVANLGIFQWKP